MMDGVDVLFALEAGHRSRGTLKFPGQRDVSDHSTDGSLYPIFVP